MTATAATPRAYDPIDLSSRAFWSTSAQERERSFADAAGRAPGELAPPGRRRACCPTPTTPATGRSPDATTLSTVSRNNEVFLSGKGVMFENFPVELLEASQSFLAMDPPRHTLPSQTRQRRVHPAAGQAHRGFDQGKREDHRARSSKLQAAVPISSTSAPRSCPSARCRTWWASLSRSGNAWRTPPTPWSRRATRNTSMVATRWRCCSRRRHTCIRWPACSPQSAGSIPATTCSPVW